jgi:2-amino-4-hydroxy-6-hydroxymethyldihydropteridine diphosphokinase
MPDIQPPTVAEPHAAVPCWVALGANLGDPARTLTRAIDALRALPDVEVEAVSGFLCTAPVGPAQPRYVNAALRLRSRLPPLALLDVLQALEASFGRRRAERWGPRTLDLDIALMGAEGQAMLALPRLVVPHPWMHLRTFVLKPLLELDPHLVHPRSGLSLAAHLDALLSAGALL